MKVNQNTVLIGEKVLLVPYGREHVPVRALYRLRQAHRYVD